jgi:transposase
MIQLNTRKFRCRNELCRRKVFCERLPKVVESYGRKTVRLQELFGVLAFVLGGQAGAKTASRIGLKTSSDTLLRRIRRVSISTDKPVRILGVDDFAFRRGERYGTILVDLQERKPIDLLPDREAATLAEWLKKHPEIEVVSRDRASGYASAGKEGSPQTLQVADRFHLLKNLLDALERFLSRQTVSINTAFASIFQLPLSKPQSNLSLTEKLLTPAQQLLNEQKLATRTAHELHFQRVKQLSEKGTPILRIARQLKMSRNTVKKFLKYQSPPPRQSCRQRYSPIHRFVPYLRQRWLQGERNARRLWEEIKKQGYSGAQQTLCHFLQNWRDNSRRKVQTSAALKTSEGRAPSVKSVKWLLFGSKRKTKEWENSFLEQLIQNNPDFAVAQTLTKEFHQTLMSRQDQSQALETWLEKARSSGIGEFIWFANGIETDRAAVEAAHSSQWSQGQVEGQVNRLKFIKRQMYGRGSFDLLKARVLHQF